MWASLVVILFGVALSGAVLFAAAYYAQRQPQQVDPHGSPILVPGGEGAARTLLLPSSAFVLSMRTHAEVRRAALASRLKDSAAELRKLWAAKPEAARLATLRHQREEVCLAVGGFIGGDCSLLQAACPEMSDEGLARLAHSHEAMLKLFGQLAEREARLVAPRSAEFTALEEKVGLHLKALGGSKQERSSRASFLPLFRRSCLVAFAIAVFEDGTTNKQRSEERRRFGMQLLKGLGMWALTACIMRFVPQLLESIDWSALFQGFV